MLDMNNSEPKIINQKKYLCVKLEECTTPKGTEIKKVIKDNNDFIIAEICYRGETYKNNPQEKKYCYAIRWRLTEKERDHYADTQKICKGYPNVRGYPTWFVLPDLIKDSIDSFAQNHIEE